MGLNMTPGGAYNYADFDGTQAMQYLNQAQETADPKARAELVVDAQSLYEQARGSTSLVTVNEVSFLNNRLGGAVTSFAYLFMPSLAYIGGK
jgi:peptide/nickel transport system substrate-binding protein